MIGVTSKSSLCLLFYFRKTPSKEMVDLANLIISYNVTQSSKPRIQRKSGAVTEYNSKAWIFSSPYIPAHERLSPGRRD